MFYKIVRQYYFCLQIESYMITQEIIQRLLQSRKDRREWKETKCTQKTKENSEHLLGTEYFVFPKCICSDPNARCDGARRWGIWEVIRYEDGALMNGIGALNKRDLRGLSHPFYHGKTQQEGGSL